ncbi:hypothetical protein ADILRU_2531 [Leifsonia rubra CMS 76R]|nr:hypothetical protein ADILRU_2531 [Leifsonia rubra CMS 76R]
MAMTSMAPAREKRLSRGPRTRFVAEAGFVAEVRFAAEAVGAPISQPFVE